MISSNGLKYNLEKPKLQKIVVKKQENENKNLHFAKKNSTLLRVALHHIATENWAKTSEKASTNENKKLVTC